MVTVGPLLIRRRTTNLCTLILRLSDGREGGLICNSRNSKRKHRSTLDSINIMITQLLASTEISKIVIELSYRQPRETNIITKIRLQYWCCIRFSDVAGIKLCVHTCLLVRVKYLWSSANQYWKHCQLKGDILYNQSIGKLGPKGHQWL